MKLPRYLQVEVPITLRFRARSVRQLPPEKGKLILDVSAPKWAMPLGFVEMAARLIYLGVKMLINPSRYYIVKDEKP